MSSAFSNSAGLFDPGWAGKATLELSNLSRMPDRRGRWQAEWRGSLRDRNPAVSRFSFLVGRADLFPTRNEKRETGFIAPKNRTHQHPARSRLIPLPPIPQAHILLPPVALCDRLFLFCNRLSPRSAGLRG